MNPSGSRALLDYRSMGRPLGCIESRVPRTVVSYFCNSYWYAIFASMLNFFASAHTACQ